MLITFHYQYIFRKRYKFILFVLIINDICVKYIDYILLNNNWGTNMKNNNIKIYMYAW